MKFFSEDSLKLLKKNQDHYLCTDLVIVDGGKGQYSVSQLLNELGLHDLPVLAVAKGKRRNAGEEKIYHKSKEFILNKSDSLLFYSKIKR